MIIWKSLEYPPLTSDITVASPDPATLVTLNSVMQVYLRFSWNVLSNFFFQKTSEMLLLLKMEAFEKENQSLFMILRVRFSKLGWWIPLVKERIEVFYGKKIRFVPSICITKIHHSHHIFPIALFSNLIVFELLQNLLLREILPSLAFGEFLIRRRLLNWIPSRGYEQQDWIAAEIIKNRNP